MCTLLYRNTTVRMLSSIYTKCRAAESYNIHLLLD